MAERKIKLFHGSKSGIKGRISPVSRTLCDFGRGFYMGTEIEQPMTLICNYDDATLYDLELNTSNLIIKDIPLNIEWALFVAFNRGRLTKDVSPELYEKYLAYSLNTSEENRKSGISLANDICRKYRREGKYFDELIRG